MIGLAPGTRVWLADGVTDMCKGFEPQCSGRLVGDRMIRYQGGIRRPDFRDLLPQGMSRPAGARRKVEKPVLLSVRQRCHLSVMPKVQIFPPAVNFEPLRNRFDVRDRLIAEPSFGDRVIVGFAVAGGFTVIEEIAKLPSRAREDGAGQSIRSGAAQTDGAAAIGPAGRGGDPQPESALCRLV